jgi:tetratricopeptide (TPR) repeat protein
MTRTVLTIVLLLVLCFGLAARLDTVRSTERGQSGRSESALALVLGEGRALFANEFFAKADAYFHRGAYPSIFETVNRQEDEAHMFGGSEEDAHDHASEGAVGGHDHGDEHSQEDTHDHKPDAETHDHSDHANPGAGKKSSGMEATDWIERFGMHFRIAGHGHLENGAEREMLPWLKLTTELDPHNVDAYTVAAYWLRDRLGKVDQAEDFLQEGLRNNPADPELLHELASLKMESRGDVARARNLWRAALREWNEREQAKQEPDNRLIGRILGGLYQVELHDKKFTEAIHYLEILKKHSPNPESVQQKIDEIRSTAVNSTP